MARKKSAGGREEVIEDVAPIILVPTPAQLAAGQRIVDVASDSWPDSVRLMVGRAQRAGGWRVRVTYSQYLASPYRGERKLKHTMAVRLVRECDGVQAYGMWQGEDDKGWSADSAQAKHPELGMCGPFGVTELGRLVDGTMMITRWQYRNILVPVKGQGT